MFLFLYFKEYETSKEIEQQNQLMEMKRVQTEKELEAIRRPERSRVYPSPRYETLFIKYCILY